MERPRLVRDGDLDRRALVVSVTSGCAVRPRQRNHRAREDRAMNGGTQASQRSEPGAGTLKAVAVVLYVVCAVLIVLERYARGPLLIPELIGSVLAPIIF